MHNQSHLTYKESKEPTFPNTDKPFQLSTECNLIETVMAK